MTISKRQSVMAIRLLSQFQLLLNSVIDTATVTGTGLVMCPDDAREVRRAQVQWGEAERLKKQLRRKQRR
jgi:hypothetical protein